MAKRSDMQSSITRSQKISNNANSVGPNAKKGKKKNVGEQVCLKKKIGVLYNCYSASNN